MQTARILLDDWGWVEVVGVHGIMRDYGADADGNRGTDVVYLASWHVEYVGDEYVDKISDADLKQITAEVAEVIDNYF
jgi:hypothetical protein